LCHQRVGVHLSQIRGIAIYLALRLVPYCLQHGKENNQEDTMTPSFD
jgi:hypothetical protein